MFRSVLKGQTLPFSLGAFQDALCYRATAAREWSQLIRLTSPLKCLLFLATLAVTSALTAFQLPYEKLLLLRSPAIAHLMILSIAVLILPATTALSLGEYPSDRYAFRRWIFLSVKIALLLPIVLFGTLDLAPLTSTHIQPHGLLVGYVLALRWALTDQRQRCPVCLCLLTNPTHIGCTSQTFLGWYGTELMCAKGHGLMHVPEIPSSSCTTQRWLNLDASWSSLFQR